MRVPQANLFSSFSPMRKPLNIKTNVKPIQMKNDEVVFGSTAGYIKKYKTLPDDIKQNLSPKEAMDMFQDMERVANGTSKRTMVGTGTYSNVYDTPWLKDYYLLILNDTNYPTHTIYSENPVGDAVWCDKDNPRIQIINKSV